MLIYLTHVYSRLVHTPPIYLNATSKSEQTVDENGKNEANKSFILHRRHLPLTKTIEINKLYPHHNAFNNCTPVVEELLVKLNPPNESLQSFIIEHHSNKAPPISC